MVIANKQNTRLSSGAEVSRTRSVNKRHHRPSVLIIDRNRHHLDIFSEFMESEGYRTITARSIKEALKKLYPVRPALIVTELRLPDRRGGEVVEELMLYNPEVPVIVHTCDQEYQSDPVTQTIAAYVMKSSDPSELLLEVRKVMEGEFTQ
jgi:DNA-binding NtrC family response regulator